MISQTCRMCTLQGYESRKLTAHFRVVVGEGREDPYFIIPRAHIELLELHPLFAAEMWGLVRDVADESGLVFMSGANAGGHGYLAISIEREADERWKVVAAA